MKINKQILRLAIPNIVTNITVPLLGMVDTAIVGHIGGASLIGAIALGTMIFNLIYWNFGFLRMGTTGPTAQAFGAGRHSETVHILTRGCVVAIGIAALLLALQRPIAQAARLILVESNPATIELALTYFFIRIWAAPANLLLYAIKGWFIGMQDAKTPMVVAIVLNITNIAASLVLAVGYRMGIAGIAWGTVVAQYTGLALAIAFWWHRHRALLVHFNLKIALQWQAIKSFFVLNSDIFLRTICLCAVFTFIPIASGAMGDNILAANTLLMQLFTLFSYFLDGFAYAGEALVGRFVGERRTAELRTSIRLLTLWGFVLALVFGGIYLLWGEEILAIFTNSAEVIAEALAYVGWTAVVPLAGFLAFIFDGVYVGATASKSMRNVMFVATAAFFGTYYACAPHLANNAIWLAFIVFLALRGLLMWAWHYRIVAHSNCVSVTTKSTERSCDNVGTKSTN